MVVSASADQIAGEHPDAADHVAGDCLSRVSVAPECPHRRRIGALDNPVLEVARHSIPIAKRLCSGLVQGILCPPPRRAIVSLIHERSCAAPPGKKCSALHEPLKRRSSQREGQLRHN